MRRRHSSRCRHNRALTQCRLDPCREVASATEGCWNGFVNLPDAGRVVGHDPNLGNCSRSARHHVPLCERSGRARAPKWHVEVL